jgi:hypothetical protein
MPPELVWIQVTKLVVWGKTGCQSGNRHSFSTDTLWNWARHLYPWTYDFPASVN